MKPLLTLIGILSLTLGVVGIALPLLPTTPFLLLAAALFIRSSPRLHAWLLRSPLLGKYIRNYREKRAMPLHAKVVSISILWLSILYAIIFATQLLWLRLLLLLIAVGVTWHLVTLGTIRRGDR